MNSAKRRPVVIAALFLVAVLLFVAAGCGGGPSTAEQQAAPQGEVTRHEGGYRFDCNGWTYVHIEGEPYERGYQHGKLVAGELAEIMKMLEHTTLNDTGREWSYFVEAAERVLVREEMAEFLEEIKGIADGAKSAGTDISWQEVLAWNGRMEMMDNWYPGVLAGAYGDGADNTRCSAFIATGSYTTDGRVVMAHNDWDEYVSGQYANVVLDIEPSQGHRMIMQSFPGYIASMTDYFVTDAGIMGTETTIGGFNGYDPERMPEFYRMRKATQYADTVDQWIEQMLADNNGGYANSWLLADSESGEIARFELGLDYHNVERKTDGYFVGFNAATDPRIRNLECDGSSNYYDTRTPAAARRVRLTQLMEDYRGELDTDAAKTILADHYDVYLNKADNPGSRTVDGHYELDPFEYWQARTPYYPKGSLDGKVMDSEMAKEMTFVFRWGNSCGMPFDAQEFFREHPQYDYLEGYIKDRPTQPWTRFKAGSNSP